jgi:hypothetical protein
MAEHRLAAAPPAQLPDRHAGGALSLWRGRVRRSRTVPDVGARSGMTVETPAVRP